VALRPRPKSGVETTAPILLATAFTVLVSPHYAWYFAWVLPFLCRYVYVPLLYVTLASFAFYLSEVVGYYADFRAGIALYGGFVILAAVDLWSRSRPSSVRRPA
jgi:alpha-1,6-mannosyltransferase